MPTFNELAQQYVARLVGADDAEREFGRILTHLSGQVYETTNLSISKEDKVQVIELVIEKLEALFPRRIGPMLESADIVKAFSNDNYLELIRCIKGTIKK